jgi:hypothetical protein
MEKRNSVPGEWKLLNIMITRIQDNSTTHSGFVTEYPGDVEWATQFIHDYFGESGYRFSHFELVRSVKPERGC